jgi:ABC-type amino acid transport substrate-binding protein
MLLLVGLATVAMGLAGCGTSNSNSDSGGNLLEHIKSSHKLKVGVKFDTAPYGYVPEGASKPVGFDIDLTYAIAKKLGVPKANVDLVQVTSENRIPYLQTGKVDFIMASMTYERDREASVDFTLAYYRDAYRILVPEDSSIASFDDLAGKTVAIAQGGDEKQILGETQPDAKVRSFQDWTSTVAALTRGEADALVSTQGLLTGLQQQAEKSGTKLKFVGEGIHPTFVGGAVQEDHSDLRDAIDFALEDIQADGTYAKIYHKWWGNGVDVYQIHSMPG